MEKLSDKELQDLVEKIVKEKMSLTSTKPSPVPAVINTNPSDEQRKTIAIGSDHGGFTLKESLIKYIAELGYEPVDCGAANTNPVDYPDFARLVAIQVASGKAWRGVMIDGAGIGSCMVANKVPGVRASMCYDLSTASNAREHNDANVLTLGAGLIGENLARQILKTWLSTQFGGGRHLPRVEKIISVEKEFSK